MQTGTWDNYIIKYASDGTIAVFKNGEISVS